MPKEHIKKVIHLRDRAHTKARIRGAIADCPSKNTPVATPWRKTRGYVLLRRIWSKMRRWRTHCDRQKFHTTVLTHLTSKRNVATRQRCFVVLPCRIQRAIEHMQFIRPCGRFIRVHPEHLKAKSGTHAKSTQTDSTLVMKIHSGRSTKWEKTSVLRIARLTDWQLLSINQRMW